MRNFFALVFILQFAGEVYCQEDNSQFFYWVRFKDKSTDGYSLSNPIQFLSQAAIDRRSKQNIAIDSSDLPITQSYINALSPNIGSLRHRLKWFNMVIVEIADTINTDSINAQVNAIKQLPFVDSIAPIATYPYSYTAKMLERNNKFESLSLADQSIVYPDVHGAAYHQLNMMNADLLHKAGYKGQGIIIAMMDNGLSNANLNPYFDSVRPRILGTWDFVHNQEDIYHDGGHGVNTFGCVAANIPYQYIGSAPGASYYLYQTEDNNAEWVMEEYNWAAAAEKADSAGAQIFSTSLAYTTFDNNIGNNTYADLNGYTTVMTQAGNIAAGKGILVFNAAGNEGNDTWHYIGAPADGDSIIAVGAVDSLDTIGTFSSYGPNSAGRIKPDLCAQGQGDYLIGVGANISVGGGTSFSCPILAGCAACLWGAFPDKSAKDIQTAIMLSADRFWYPNNRYGYGIPNFYNAYALLQTNYNNHILQQDNDIVAYPNPFSTQLNVSLYCAEAGNHTLELFDVNGQKVLSQQFYVRAADFDLLTIDGSSIPDGEYVLRYDQQKKYAHKVVKMH